MSSMTEEQRKRMEENRRRAMAIRDLKLQQQSKTSNNGHQISQTPKSSRHMSQTPKSTPQNSQISKSLSQCPQAAQSTAQLPPRSKSFDEHATPSTKGCLQSKFYQKHSNSSQASSSRSPNYASVKRGSLELISNERFELSMLYHQPTIDAVKTITGRAYDSVKKNWNFPLSEYYNVLTALRKLEPAVVVDELPTLVTETFLKPKTYPSDIDLSRIQSSIRSTLLDFQVQGVKYAVSRGGRVLIADDMGLGKTIQALAVADYYRNDWPLLVVCPSSMRYQWVAEIQKHLRNVDQDNIFVITNGKDVLSSDYQIVIISYDLMTTFKEQILARKFDVVIMDESHHIKNPKTLRTQAGSAILQSCRRCVLLSGTPALSRPVELHCQLKCIKPRVFKDFMAFAKRYCDAKETTFGWDFSGSKNMQELNVVLKELLMIRRLKSDVLSQLPPKTREVVVLESTGKQLRETSKFAQILESEGLRGAEKHTTLMSYFQETASAKIKKVTQYIKDTVERGEKFIVFAHHSIMLDAICSAIERSKTDYIRIDGSVPSEVRKQLCNYFQEQENCMAAVLSIKAANTGLTFTAAHLVIFAELYWNPGELIQAEDRAHRIGQADSVLVQYLVQNGSADDQIWPLVQKKFDLLHKAGLSQEEFKVSDIIQAKSGKNEKDIKDYFLDDDDVALAELDISKFENSFKIPEKKPRTE